MSRRGKYKAQVRCPRRIFNIGRYPPHRPRATLAGHGAAVLVSGWLDYLAVAPEHQRQGLGRTIMREAERLLREAGCPKINLQARTSNHGVIEFYRRIGYAVDEVVSMGKRLEQDGA